MTYADAKAFNKTNAMVDVIFSDLFKGNFTSDMFVASNEDLLSRIQCINAQYVLY
jgi:hypothetical protein